MWTAVVWTAEVRRHKHSDSQIRAGYFGMGQVGLGGFGVFCVAGAVGLHDDDDNTSPPSTVQICSCPSFQLGIGFAADCKCF